MTLSQRFGLELGKAADAPTPLTMTPPAAIATFLGEFALTLEAALLFIPAKITVNVNPVPTSNLGSTCRGYDSTRGARRRSQT